MKLDDSRPLRATEGRVDVFDRTTRRGADPRRVQLPERLDAATDPGEEPRSAAAEGARRSPDDDPVARNEHPQSGSAHRVVVRRADGMENQGSDARGVDQA